MWIWEKMKWKQPCLGIIKYLIFQKADGEIATAGWTFSSTACLLPSLLTGARLWIFSIILKMWRNNNLRSMTLNDELLSQLLPASQSAFVERCSCHCLTHTHTHTYVERGRERERERAGRQMLFCRHRAAFRLGGVALSLLPLWHYLPSINSKWSAHLCGKWCTTAHSS